MKHTEKVDPRSLVVLLAVVWIGCSQRQPAVPAKVAAPGKTAAAAPANIVDCNSLPPQAIAKNNRGVGLMGQFEYAKAREVFTELVNEYPGCLELSVNLAIAELNASQSGATALPRLAKVLAVDPQHVRANYLSGILHIRENRNEEAIPFLEPVARADPRDPYVALHLATCYETTSREKALEWYRKAVELDPLFRTAYYKLFILNRQSSSKDEALRYLEEFQKLEKHPRTHVFDFKHTLMGPKADVIRLDGPPSPPVAPPQGELFATPTPLLADIATHMWSRDVERANVTIADLDGKGNLLVLLAGALDGEVPNVVLRRTADGQWSEERSHPFNSITQVNAALWGDYDNDGLTDVYLCRRGPNQLWRQTGLNQWQDVTESSHTAGGDLDTVDGAFFDADHDGDLDLFLVNKNGANELFNNNLDGTFRPLASQCGLAGDGTASIGILFADLDGDRDLDIIVLHAAAPHDVYWNERIWNYRPATGFDRFRAARITAIVAGDLDADGQVELYSAGDDGLVRWRPDEQRAWQPTVLAPQELRGAQPSIALADVNGDGQLELVGGREQWGLSRIEANRATRMFLAEGPALAAWALAQVDESQGPSIIELPRGAAPTIRRPGPGRYPFVTLVTSGKTTGATQERSNASGIGTWLEIRLGRETTVLSGARSESGPGQSLQPVSIGMGGRERADYVRMQWTDGVWQSELDVPAQARHRFEETNRIPTSCPILFVWTGSKFEFVSDLLGVGGLGYFVAPGEYAPPNPAENFLLPHGCLAPHEGCYRLKLTEPMEELTYLDNARMAVYDLPPGWQMTLDERMGVSPPLPTGEPRFYRHSISPVKAVNDRNEDVTTAVAERDTVAAPPGKLHPHFIGMLEREHVLHLTWPSPLDAPVGQPLLIADGWIEYPYSQTAFMAWQAGRRFEAPTIEARSPGGEWITVLEKFGYPAGMPRQMSVPLAGLPQGTTELRLRTNQEIYWDRLAVAFAEPCPAVRRQMLSLKQAILREGGFTPRVVNEQRRPFFDDAVRHPLASTRDPAGFYTEFGRVDELVGERDDALAIFGPGEEIELAFVAPTQPPAEGWRREFVLEVLGWCKDMDLYTQHGETVEPVPSRNGPSPHRDALHARFNTRYQSGR